MMACSALAQSSSEPMYFRVALPHTFYAVLAHGRQERLKGFEVVEWLHLPESKAAEAAFPDEDAYEEYLDALEDEAFEVVGAPNPYKGEDGEVLERRSRWTPEGRITVDENQRPTRSSGPNLLGQVGVQEVKITVWRAFRSRSGYTDRNGRFRLRSTRRDHNWRISFKTEDELKVVGAWGTVRKFRRPGDRTRSPWRYHFHWWSSEWMSSTIVNGAHQYDRLRATHGLASPWHSFQLLNVRTAFGSTDTDSNNNRHSPWPLTNRIKLWSATSNGTVKCTDGLQRTLAHELTHSAHYKAGQWHMLNSTDLMTESYAVFVEWLFCERYYPHQSTAWDADKQNENFDEMSDGYSAVFIDLEDDVDQCTDEGDRPDCQDWPDDWVVAYVNPEYQAWVIQNAVFAEKEINDVDDYLLRTYPNNSQNELMVILIRGYEGIE